MSDSTDDSVETVISALDSRLPQSLSPSGSLSPEDSISATPASPEPDEQALTFEESHTDMGNRFGGEKKKKKEDKPEEKKTEEKPKKKGKKSKGKSKRNSQNVESDGAAAQGACALPSGTSPKQRKSNKRPDVLADLGAHSPGSTLGSPSSTTGSQGTWSLDDESDVSTLGYSTPLLSTPQVQRYVIQPQSGGQQTSSERLEQLGRSIERTIVDNLTDVPPGQGTPLESPVSTSERPKGKRNVKKKRALGQAVLDCDPFKLPLQEDNQAAAPSPQTQRLNVGTEKISLRASQESQISPWLKDDDMPVDEEQMDEMFISCIDLSYNLADICSEKEFTEYGSLDSKRPAKPKTEKPKSKESSLSPSLVRKALDLNTSPWSRSPQMKLKLRAADSCDTPPKSDESSTSTLAESGLDTIPEPSFPECLTAATAQLAVRKEQDIVPSPSQAEGPSQTVEIVPNSTEESSSATSPTSPQAENVSTLVHSPGTDTSQQSSKKKSGKSKSKSKSKNKKAKEKEKILSEVPCIKSDIPTNEVAPVAACLIEKGPEIKLIPKESTTSQIKKNDEERAEETQKVVTPEHLEPPEEDKSVICEKLPSLPGESEETVNVPKEVETENASSEAAIDTVPANTENDASNNKDETGVESKAGELLKESSVDNTNQKNKQVASTVSQQQTADDANSVESQISSESSARQPTPRKDSPKTENLSPTEPASPKHVPPPSPSAMDALAEADEEDEENMEDNQQSKVIQLFGETVFKRLSSLVESQSQDEDQEDRVKDFSDNVEPDDVDSRPVDLGSMGFVPEFDKSSDQQVEGEGQREMETPTNLAEEEIIIPGSAMTVEKSIVSASAEITDNVSQISTKTSEDIGETYFKEGNEEEPVDDDTLTRKKKKKPGQKKSKKEKQQGNVVKKPEIPKELKQMSTSDNDSNSKSNEKAKHGRKKKKSESEKDPPKRASQQIQEVIDAYGLADDIVDVSVERMTDDDDEDDDFEEFRPRYEDDDDDDDSDTCDTKSSGIPSRLSVEASKYIPEIEETFSELLSVKHILEDLEDRTPTEEVLPPFVSSDGLRSPPDFLNGRRSRMSPAVTDRTESDLDISEQRDDISTDSMYADDEDDGTTEVLFSRSYSEPDGNEVVLSCTFYNTTHNATDSDDFWEDYSTADESYKQIEVSADAASSTFQNARKQMHDIHQHLQDLRRQMEHLQEDVENATLTPEYSMDSEEVRFVTE